MEASSIVEETITAVKAELARIKRVLEALPFTGSYDDLKTLAERIIVIEVVAYDEGFYDDIKEELTEIKRIIARMSTVYRVAFTATHKPLRRRKPRR